MRIVVRRMAAAVGPAAVAPGMALGMALGMTLGVLPLSPALPAALADDTVTVNPPPAPPGDPGDGSLPAGDVLTAFDVADPAIGNLEPALLTAIQNATTAAAADGITMTINSGWRSPQFQQRLLDDAVQTYGTLALARRYVETPEGSRHVTGQAVDVGGAGADQWLIAHGPRFGLCQIYANEVWHFELAADHLGSCPPLLPDAAG